VTGRRRTPASPRASKALAEKGINIRAIATSEIKLSMLIDDAYTELVMRTSHTLYGRCAALSSSRMIEATLSSPFPHSPSYTPQSRCSAMSAVSAETSREFGHSEESFRGLGSALGNFALKLFSCWSLISWVSKLTIDIHCPLFL
jgi:hypothetical protein